VPPSSSGVKFVILAQLFTEGFGTADLKDAKALLDELNTRPIQNL
jgi:hypothetical protein